MNLTFARDIRQVVPIDSIADLRRTKSSPSHRRGSRWCGGGQDGEARMFDRQVSQLVERMRVFSLKAVGFEEREARFHIIAEAGGAGVQLSRRERERGMWSDSDLFFGAKRGAWW